jgi:hypothetical protein
MQEGWAAEAQPAEREAAAAARAAKTAAVHEWIGEQVEGLTADPAWRATIERLRQNAAARRHRSKTAGEQEEDRSCTGEVLEKLAVGCHQEP